VIAKSVISQYRLSRGLWLFAVWCIFFAATAAGQVGSAIEPPATTSKGTAVDLPPFAVATIKPVAVADSDPSSMRFSDDGVSFRSVFVAWIVSQAFSAQPVLSREDDRILGLPSWTKSERYDVEAKVDDEDVPKWRALSLSQQGFALQSLLVRRFNLQFHHETRERPTYSLVAAKNDRIIYSWQGVLLSSCGLARCLYVNDVQWPRIGVPNQIPFGDAISADSAQTVTRAEETSRTCRWA
jgi:Protein of unknown function (DUF3738)